MWSETQIRLSNTAGYRLLLLGIILAFRWDHLSPAFPSHHSLFEESEILAFMFNKTEQTEC